MKKVSDTQAKTPSGTTRTEEILDDISVLVGQISKAEDLCVSNLKTISSALDAKLLAAIVHNTKALVEFSSTQSTALMGIAGYLFGYKGINSKTSAASLFGKFKNTEPLFVSHTNALKDLGDKLTEIINNSGISGKTSKGGTTSTLNIVLSSVDGGNLDSLINLINELKKTGKVENIEVLVVIQSLLQQLDALGKMELDTELISMKMDDVQLALFNIGETFNELSKLERRINGIDVNVINAALNSLSKFDFARNLKNIKRLIKFINDVAELNVPKNINKSILENTNRITEFIKLLVSFYNEMDNVPKVNYNKIINSIVKNIDALPKLLNSITSIDFKGINGTRAKQLDILVAVFDQLYTILNYIEFLSYTDYVDALDIFSEDILPYFESGKKKGLVERIADIPFKKFNNNTIKRITSFEFTVLAVGDVLKAIKGLLPIMAIIERSKKDIIKAIDVLYDIIEIINEKTSTTKIKASIDNIHPYAELMKDLATIFKYVILTGALSIPALVGGLLLSVTLKTIFTVLGGALNSIQKFVSNKDTKTSIESMKTVIVSISLLMIFASIMGGIVMKYWDNILVFLGMFTAFAFAVLGTITLIGGLINKFGAKGGIEALSKLTDIIVACTFCMLAGALFMMIPNIESYISAFTKVFSIFVGALLGTFLLVSLISGRKIKAQMDEFAKLIAICGGALMIGASFMMIPNMWIHAIEFGSLIWAFTSVMLISFLLISKIGGRKIRAQMDEFAKLIAICAGVLIVGALFMMIPEYKLNTLIFAGILAAFVGAIVLTITLYSKYAKNAKFAALSLMLFTMVTTATLMYGSNFIKENGKDNIILFGVIVAVFTLSMVGTMILLTKAASNIVMGTLCMAALVGVTYLIGFALQNIAYAYKIFEGPGEAFICLGWIAAVLLTFTGVIFGLGTLMGTGVGTGLFIAGVAALASIVGVVWTLGEAMKSISDGIKYIRELSKSEDQINVDNITNLIGSIKDIAVKFDVLDEIPLKNIKRSSKIIKMISTSISSISGVVKDTASLKIPIYSEDGSIAGYRQLKEEDFKLVSDNIGMIVTSLSDALGKAYDNNKELFKGNKSRKVIKTVKGISEILTNIADGISAISKLEIPKYNDNGTITGTTKLEITSVTALTKNVGLIITSLCGALGTAYDNNQELFKGLKATKVLHALKEVSSVINKFTDAIIKFANSEYPEYDENGNPTGKKVHINDTIIGQMKGSIETLITAVLGSISEIYAKPETQELFKGRNLKNATNAIKDVSAIIGGLGKDIVDLAALYIKDENGNVVQMNSTHFAKAKQNLKDIITCILTGVDDLSKDANFKKFTESGGLFGNNKWDVPTNIKKNLDKVKPLIDSAIENINSINEAIKLLPSEGENGTRNTWADLLAVIFDPLKSFEIEDEDTTKRKKESIKKSLENAKSIINEVNKLDEGKADKFIKLSQELRDLSVNVGDMSGFIETLNGKINDTLNKVSESLIESTTALQKSDEAHKKRNEIIKQNTAELKRVLETPMKVNVITTTSGSTQTSFADANIGGGEAVINGINDTTTSGSTSRRTGASIDNSTLTSIAGTTADILAALRELLEKQ